MPTPKKKNEDPSNGKAATSVAQAKTTPAEGNGNAAKTEKSEIQDAKAKGREAKRAEIKGLRPVKHYDQAATSTADFVKPVREEEEDEEDEGEVEE